MTDATMKTIAHSSEIPPYSSGSSTWLAIAKNANVTSPVVAMPIERIRAPRPYEDPEALLDTHEQHRPGERRPCLHDLTVPGQELHEAALGPVVQVTRGVPEVLPVRAAGHVEAAPQRLARHRDEQVPARHARHLGDGVLRVRDVLEHLDRAGDVELVVAERQVLRLHDEVLEVRRLPRLPLL